MPFKIHAHVRPCGFTDRKPMDVEFEIDGDQNVEYLKEQIADKTRIPSSLLVLYSKTTSSTAEKGLHDGDKITTAFAGSRDRHTVDVHVDESGMPEFTDAASGVMRDSGHGQVAPDSKIRFGGHGGLAGRKGHPGPQHS